MTICTSCKHCHLYSGKWGNGIHHCRAAAAMDARVLNPVTGKRKPTFTKNPTHLLCCDVNLNGNCPYFEAKEQCELSP